MDKTLTISTLPPLDVPAFDVLRPDRQAAPVLFASPHSGSHYPDDFTSKLRVDLMDLRRTEDAYIDQLFGHAPKAGAALVKANYARSYVDLNRDARELDDRMFIDGLPRQSGLPGHRVKAGLGSLPRIGAQADNIYAEQLTQAEGARRLDLIHDVYHDALSTEIEHLKTKWPEVVLVDCHSMPSTQPGRKTLPDIVLGDRFGSSCSSKLTQTVEQVFRRAGLSVGRNAPYAGGYTTRRYGRPRRGTHVLQIEVNRGLYLDEDRVETSDQFEQIQTIIATLVDAIIDFTSFEFT